MPPFKFERLVRFKNAAGNTYYGEAEEKESSAESLFGKSVFVYKGANPWDDDFVRTTTKETIDQVIHFHSTLIHYMETSNCCQLVPHYELLLTV
jgi:hypothetical protein